VVAGAGIAAQRDTATLPRLAPGAAARAQPALQGRVDAGYDCARPPQVAIDAVAAQGAERLPVVVPVSCPASAPAPVPVPPKPSGPGLLDLEVQPGQRLGTVLRRGLLVAVSCEAACRVRLSASSLPAVARGLRLPRTISRPSVRPATEEPRGRRLRLTATARRTLLRAARRGARRFDVEVRATVAGAAAGSVAVLRRRTAIRR
jgi:hypothetical protein